MTLKAFQFLSPQKIVFGWGKRTEIGDLAATLGKRAFLFDGSNTLRNSPLWNEILQSLTGQGLDLHRISHISREPTVEDVDSAISKLREFNPTSGDFVIGIGGGSAIDLAKGVAALATNFDGGSVINFLEGVGNGTQITNAPLPMMAVPTTSGTGSEATKNSVVSVNDPICKKSLRSEKMVPDIVLIDPELTLSVPAHITAASGMDAVTQLIESYISLRSTPLTQSLCVEGLRLAIPAMFELQTDLSNQAARTDMSYAALLSGMALANSGLGMAHGVAAALGAYCGVSHGLACAVMLPVALRVNREAAAQQIASLARDVYREPTLSVEAAYAKLSGRIKLLNTLWNIPKTLGELGATSDQIPQLITGSRGNSMNGNPCVLSDAELTRILEEML